MSAKVKARWDVAKQIAENFNKVSADVKLSKNDVYTYILPELCESFTQGALDNDPVVLRSFPEMRGFKRMMDDYHNRPRAYREGSSPRKTPAEKVKLAMWFIDKVADGDIDEAAKVFNAAILALRELRR